MSEDPSAASAGALAASKATTLGHFIANRLVEVRAAPLAAAAIWISLLP
jgi:hypothetical protein